MFYRMLRALLMFTVMVAALMLCVAPASAETIVTDMPLTDQTILNECNGEPVLLNGTLHQEITFVTKPNGNTHSSFDATIRMNGYGQSGVYYVAKENTHNETNTRGVAQEQFFGTKLKLVSQGPETPNMVDRATLHVVIDKNNNVKVDISKHEMKCK